MEIVSYLLVFIVGLLTGRIARFIIQTGRRKSKSPALNFHGSERLIFATYYILEAIMGFSFLITAFLIGLQAPLILIFYIFITFIFVIVGFYNCLTGEIPDEIMLPAIVITGFVMYFSGLETGSSLFMGFSFITIIFGFLFFKSSGQWLGGGDVRAGALVGLLLGWPNVITGLVLGYAFGSIYSVYGRYTGRLSRKSHIPFSPFLFLGTYIAMFL